MRGLVAGSRGSKLAMAQTEFIIGQLGREVGIKRIRTRGDNIQDVALAKLEGKAFFTKEIDDALLGEEVDFAVHSFKDVPTDIPDGLVVAAVPKRESPRDALVGSYPRLEDLPTRAIIGTSSLRRRAEILRTRHDVVVEELRGNLDTRMRKLSEGLYDSIVVAEAGLKRLGYGDYHPLDPEKFIPAAGQGALAITAREKDTEVLDLLSKLEHPDSRLSSVCERLFLSTLEGGCQVPAGVYTTISPNDTTFHITGFISSLDGRRFIWSRDSGSKATAMEITENLARDLLGSGGAEILKGIRKEMI